MTAPPAPRLLGQPARGTALAHPAPLLCPRAWSPRGGVPKGRDVCWLNAWTRARRTQITGPDWTVAGAVQWPTVAELGLDRPCSQLCWPGIPVTHQALPRVSSSQACCPHLRDGDSSNPCLTLRRLNEDVAWGCPAHRGRATSWALTSGHQGPGLCPASGTGGVLGLPPESPGLRGGGSTVHAAHRVASFLCPWLVRGLRVTGDAGPCWRPGPATRPVPGLRTAVQSS